MHGMIPSRGSWESPPDKLKQRAFACVLVTVHDDLLFQLCIWAAISAAAGQDVLQQRDGRVVHVVAALAQGLQSLVQTQRHQNLTQPDLPPSSALHLAKFTQNPPDLPPPPGVRQVTWHSHTCRLGRRTKRLPERDEQAAGFKSHRSVAVHQAAQQCLDGPLLHQFDQRCRQIRLRPSDVGVAVAVEGARWIGERGVRVRRAVARCRAVITVTRECLVDEQLGQLQSVDLHLPVQVCAAVQQRTAHALRQQRGRRRVGGAWGKPGDKVANDGSPGESLGILRENLQQSSHNFILQRPRRSRSGWISLGVLSLNMKDPRGRLNQRFLDLTAPWKFLLVLRSSLITALTWFVALSLQYSNGEKIDKQTHAV